MRSPKIDPAVRADLDALDAALRGERADLEVAMITDEVRNAAEPMPPGLAQRLESAVERGFADPAKPRRSWSLWQPAVGLGAAALVAVVIAVGQSGDGGSGALDGREGGAVAPQGESTSSTGIESAGDAADGTAAAPAPAPSLAQEEAPAGGVERRVQRAADLTISVPRAELQSTADEVVRTTDRYGGYVQRSDVFAGRERGRATFELRIPAARLEDSLAALSKLGQVQSRTQTSEDITGRFTSARARLGDARAERQALLRALAEATTTQEIDSIKQRLEIANARIEAAKADLFQARRSAAFASVYVSVVDEGDSGTAGGTGEWTPRQAVGDAVDLLSVAAGVLIVGLAAAIPAALVLALLALAHRAWRRRARDLALGGNAV